MEGAASANEGAALPGGANGSKDAEEVAANQQGGDASAVANGDSPLHESANEAKKSCGSANRDEETQEVTNDSKETQAANEDTACKASTNEDTAHKAMTNENTGHKAPANENRGHKAPANQGKSAPSANQDTAPKLPTNQNTASREHQAPPLQDPTNDLTPLAATANQAQDPWDWSLEEAWLRAPEEEGLEAWGAELEGWEEEPDDEEEELEDWEVEPDDDEEEELEDREVELEHCGVELMGQGAELKSLMEEVKAQGAELESSKCQGVGLEDSKGHGVGINSQGEGPKGHGAELDRCGVAPDARGAELEVSRGHGAGFTSQGEGPKGQGASPNGRGAELEVSRGHGAGFTSQGEGPKGQGASPNGRGAELEDSRGHGAGFTSQGEGPKGQGASPNGQGAELRAKGADPSSPEPSRWRSSPDGAWSKLTVRPGRGLARPGPGSLCRVRLSAPRSGRSPRPAPAASSGCGRWRSVRLGSAEGRWAALLDAGLETMTAGELAWLRPRGSDGALGVRLGRFTPAPPFWAVPPSARWPSVASAHARAAHLLRRGRPGAAARAFRRCLRAAVAAAGPPPAPAAVGELKAELHAGLAAAQIRLGLPAAAAANAGKALALRPAHLGARYARGVARAAMMDLEAAREDLLAVLRARPGHAGAARELGRVRDKARERDTQLATRLGKMFA